MALKIEKIKGVGPKTKIVLNELNIFTTNDLLLNLPKRYEYFTFYENLDFRNHNEVVAINVEVNSNLVINNYTNTKVIKFEVIFNNKTLEVVTFNQPYLINVIKPNDLLYIVGKYDYNKNQIALNKFSKNNSFSEIKPIYNIESINDVNLTKIIKNIINNKKFELKENLPQKIIEKYNLLNRSDAILNIHLPSSVDKLKDAIRRIKYEEAYKFQKEMVKSVNVLKERAPINYNLDQVKSLIEKLPFELTKDQKSVVNELYHDLKLNHTTYRLIQGDVGSGKTVVAMIATYGVLTANKQVALMAPTEILAKQNYESISKYFKNEYETVLLTSATKNKEKVKEEIRRGKIKFVVGTHALATDDLKFNNLSLIIIDEQHKFGVNTRNKLLKKGNANLIYLTATPIPRTLAISLFGDAKISQIKEKPKGRKKIITKYLNNDEILVAIDKLKEILKKNQKAYVVVPAISSKHAKFNVENVYLSLKKHIPNYNNIYKLHGRIKSEEQEEIIKKFNNDKSAVLVATSMIEVGVDNKDATLIIIFAADYFGLSQLHQLRGRVGRGNLDSYCYLISEKDDLERLSIIEKVDDGFLLSEHDLKLRGPGALLGLEQTGHFNFKYLDFVKDYKILVNLRNDIITANKSVL